MRKTAVALIIASVALIGVGVSLLIDDSTSSGDVAAVEEALGTDKPVVLGPVPTTAAESEANTESQPPADIQPPVPLEISPPIGLRIDALSVDAPIGAYGVDQSTGQMAVPDNVTEVGWYRFGPRPGENGSAVLAAHVDLAGSGPGVFFDLRTLQDGDRVVVLHEDGSESPFRVIARTTYEKQELPLDVIFSREGPAVLTLITCGGDFNSNVARYDSNVVVYAVPDLGTEPTEGSTL